MMGQSVQRGWNWYILSFFYSLVVISLAAAPNKSLANSIKNEGKSVYMMTPKNIVVSHVASNPDRYSALSNSSVFAFFLEVKTEGFNFQKWIAINRNRSHGKFATPVFPRIKWSTNTAVNCGSDFISDSGQFGGCSAKVINAQFQVSTLKIKALRNAETGDVDSDAFRPGIPI